jgi:hypothetical protein
MWMLLVCFSSYIHTSAGGGTTSHCLPLQTMSSKATCNWTAHQYQEVGADPEVAVRTRCLHYK